MFDTSISSSWQPTCAVFDCDGVLLDSESTWLQAQKELFDRFGATFTQEIEESLVGSSALNFARVLAEHTMPAKASLEEGRIHEHTIIKAVQEVEIAMLKRGIEPVPGALETIQKLSTVMPVAVASNSSAELLGQKMETFGFAPHLTTWVGADDVVAAKPAPDMYLEAIRRLGGKPQTTLTVEDSVTGARAAQAAGTKTLIFTAHGDSGASGNGRFDSFRDPHFLTALNSWIAQAHK